MCPHLCVDPGHPNVLRLHATLVDERCLYLVLDYIPGHELFDFQRQAPEPLAQHLLWQLLQAIKQVQGRSRLRPHTLL